MPLEIEEDGFEVMIYTRDEHEPPHVHVWKGKGEAVINLGGVKGGYPEIYEVNKEISKKEAKRAYQIVMENNGFLLKRWKEIWEEVHGKND